MESRGNTESRRFSYLERAAANLKYQIGQELEDSKKEVLNIIDINKTKMIRDIERSKPRDTGDTTGSGKRLKKNKHTRRYKKKQGRKTRNNRR